MLNCCVTYLMLASASYQWEFLLFQASQIFVVMVYPIMRTAMTAYFGKSRYGEALAAMGTLEQTIAMIGPAIMQQVYRGTATVSIAVGAVNVNCVTFVCGAGCSLLACVVTFCLKDFPSCSEH